MVQDGASVDVGDVGVHNASYLWLALYWPVTTGISGQQQTSCTERLAERAPPLTRLARE